MTAPLAMSRLALKMIMAPFAALRNTADLSLDFGEKCLRFRQFQVFFSCIGQHVALNNCISREKER